jgi:hypothetical protein
MRAVVVTSSAGALRGGVLGGEPDRACGGEEQVLFFTWDRMWVRQAAWLRSERASEGGTVRPALCSSRGGRCAIRAAQHIALGRRGRATAAATVA